MFVNDMARRSRPSVPAPAPAQPIELPSLRLALRVAELGSVAAAARESDLLPATATAAIRRLEAQLGAPLFARSTRALKATLEGAQFLERARHALALLDQGTAELHAPLTQVRGNLRLSVSTDLGLHVLRSMLDDFMRLHPQLQLELRVGDRVSDIGREPVDVAVRYGVPTSDEQIVRLMADNTAVLVASPAYLERAGTPRSVAELSMHHGIALRLSGRTGQVWTLVRRGETAEVAPRLRRATDNGLLARLWALDGHGIVLKSRLDVAADLLAGRLLRVLPEWESQAYPLTMVFARGTHLSARMRTLADFLRPRLQGLADSVSDGALRAVRHPPPV
ncbi:LysR substrate-binding domain-containing protein [Ideonella sp. DXS29W]|uniref:LysR substrate-binding domain-containing protein n=1 Tax=Ideonella lacteola TaxID=2984193 RepID=A0ABU9BSA6_9BURK